MARNNVRKIFVNLAVRDLKKSMEPFTKFGFELNPMFTASTISTSHHWEVVWMDPKALTSSPSQGQG